MFLRKDFPLAFDNAPPIGQNVEHILIGVVAERFKAPSFALQSVLKKGVRLS